MTEQNGEFQKFGRTLTHNMCDYIKSDSLFYPTFLKYGNLPSRCPVKKNYYNLTHYKVHLEDFPAVVQPSHWGVTFECSLNEEILLHSEVYVRIVKV